MPNAEAGVTAVQIETETDKPLTKADILALLKDALPAVVNSAVTNHSKRLQKDFDAKFAALTTKTKPEGEEAEEVETVETVEGKSGGVAVRAPAVAPTPDPKIAALEKQLAKLASAAEAAQKQATAERRARIESDGHSSIRSAFAGKVNAGAEQAVLDLLRGRNAIAIGDDGAVRLRLGTKDEPEDGFDLAEGVAAFTKLPEAKYFAPVPSAATATARRPNLGQPPSGGQRPNTAHTTGATDVISAFEQLHGRLEDSL